MSEFYDTLVKIYNHYSGDNSRPLATVALHPQEDLIKHGLLDESIRNFPLRNIKETFGLNYLEFMNLPSYVCEIMTEVAREELKRKATMAQGIQSELEDLNK